MKKSAFLLAIFFLLSLPLSYVNAEGTMIKDKSTSKEATMMKNEDTMMKKEDDAMMAKDGSVKEVKTFDLFWPVAAGKVPGESLYFLKSLKENIREMFIFSKYQKVDYNIVLVEKRMAEAEKLLLDNGDNANFGRALDMAKSKRAVVLDLLNQVKSDGTDTSSLVDRFKSSLEKQTELLNYWKSKAINGSDSAITTDLENVASTLSKLQS